MDMHTEKAEGKGLELGNAAKLGILGGVLALTGAIAYWYREGGAADAKKRAAGGSPTFPIGSPAWHEYVAHQRASGPATYQATDERETPQHVAAKFGVLGAAGWDSELAAVNPSVAWPIYAGQKIAIPSNWPWPTT